MNNRAIHGEAVQARSFLRWALDRLHYLGLAIVALLIFQANRSAQISEGMLKDSLKQQEALRNMLRVNLLTQRATVLSLMPLVTGDSASYQRAGDIANSIPNLLPEHGTWALAKGGSLSKEISTVIGHLINLAELSPRERGLTMEDPRRVLLDQVEHLGTDLNEDESSRWFDLLSKNEKLLKDLKEHRMEGYASDLLLVIYLALFAWTSVRRRKAEFELKQSEARDLTERQRSETLRLEKEAAEEANRAKSTFLANMSHELRTPMHGILSFSRFGLQKIETAPKEKIKGYFEEIYESGSRLMNLLNDLLDLSKLEAGKIVYSMQESDLHELAQSVRSEMSAFAEEKGLKIEVFGGDIATQGRFDGERVMQVVRNLVSNAVKFSNPGSVVRIGVEDRGERLRCVIANRGVGITEAELESVFDKFVQGSKTRTGAGGTGLGLAISREIVQQHGGKIWAESEHDGETRFIFELPKLAAKTTGLAAA